MSNFESGEIDQAELDRHCERAAEALRPLELRARCEVLKGQAERAKPMVEVMLDLGALPERLNGGCAGSHW